MHDLVEQMGKEIALQESQVPGERTRIWQYEDARNVLIGNMVQFLHFHFFSFFNRAEEMNIFFIKVEENINSLYIISL